MEKYNILEELGDGTCGIVYKAINRETSEIVAVKKMKRKFYYWAECLDLREVKSLRKLIHPNIIKLLEIVRENNDLFFIFEYMEHNLYQIMRERQRPLSEEEIRVFMSQVLHGLAHIHRNGYFHRDLKPENLLVTNKTIKVADFGLARELTSLPPFTDYVSTRWYRAPEVLLQSSFYTPAIDMWAVGAIMAELFTLSPIFPGESEIDQLYKICCVLGAPDWNTFPEAKNISRLVDVTCSEINACDLSEIITNASLEAIDLIKQLCSWDPLQRPTAEQCLQHPFFQVSTRVPRPPVDTLRLSLGPEPNLELNLWNWGMSADDCFLGLTLAVPSAPPQFEMVQNNQGSKEQTLISRDFLNLSQQTLISRDFLNLSQQSVFWSLFPNNATDVKTPVETSLSLSCSSVANYTSSTWLSMGSFSSDLHHHHHQPHHHHHHQPHHHHHFAASSYLQQPQQRRYL